mgnify:CR=1 FL=1
MKNIVYFDLETQKSFNDVGGWANKSQMLVSIGVTYSTVRGDYKIYTEDTIQELIEEIKNADLVVGYNHIQFDYGVLEGYCLLELTGQTNNLDMMLELEKLIGFRLKLDALGSATLGAGKTGNGLDALRWWQEYKKTQDSKPLIKIAKYCCYDVKVTKEVYEYAVKNKHLLYLDKNGIEQTVELDWN